jgi:hypothetical protein
MERYIVGTILVTLLPVGWFYSLIGYFIPLCMTAGIGAQVRWKGNRAIECVLQDLFRFSSGDYKPKKKSPQFSPGHTAASCRGHFLNFHAYTSSCRIYSQIYTQSTNCSRFSLLSQSPQVLFWQLLSIGKTALYLAYWNNIKLGGIKNTESLLAKQTIPVIAMNSAARNVLCSSRQASLTKKEGPLSWAIL